MTNAATGHAIYGRDKGWRKAVRFTLTENPVTGDQQQVQAGTFPNHGRGLVLGQAAGGWFDKRLG